MSDTAQEIQRQVVTVCVVAAVVTVLEAVLFFRIVTPEVQHGLRSVLANVLGDAPLRSDPVARDALRAALRAADERERALVDRINAGTMPWLIDPVASNGLTETLFNAALIAAVPVVVIAFIYAASPALRAARTRKRKK